MITKVLWTLPLPVVHLVGACIVWWTPFWMPGNVRTWREACEVFKASAVHLTDPGSPHTLFSRRGNEEWLHSALATRPRDVFYSVRGTKLSQLAS